MTKLLVILFLLSCSARAVIVLPSTAEMNATNWPALGYRLNGSGSPITNHVSYRFVLKLSTGFLGCAIGSNKVAYAVHTTAPTSVWFDDVNDVAHTTYTVTSTTTSGDFGIATLVEILPRWAAVNTNSLMGSNVVAWGWGKGFDTNAAVTTNVLRVFPLSESTYATRWGPMSLYSYDPATFSNYRLLTDSTDTNKPSAAVGGDSSGPLFCYSPGSTNWQFVGNWKSSAAATSSVEDGNTQIANATYTVNAFLESNLPDFNGYDPQPVNRPLPNITTRSIRIGQ